jgi:hypothetical protein
MQRFFLKFWTLSVLYFTISACSPSPLPPAVRLADGMINYFNDSLPAQLPRFRMVEDGAGLFLGGEKGHPSYLLNPVTADRSRFTADTLWVGRAFDYLSFYDETEANYSYFASTYSPEDSSRFGPTASLLEVSTPALFHKDNPDDSSLGYLSVAWHEMAHLTEHFEAANDLPDIMEQMMLFDSDTLLQQAIRTENELLLAAIAASNSEERGAFIQEYLALKDGRADTTANEVIAAENYYEFNEGYGRFVEHTMQERAAGFQDELLTATFGPTPPYSMVDHKWMYETVYNDYFYVLGFNKYRLLTKAGNWAFVASLKGASEKLLDDYLRELTDE